MTDDRTPRHPLDEILCTALAVGLVLVALLPAARGMSAVGWLPMWLVGMPAVAWWALHRFGVSPRPAANAVPVPVRMHRRAAAQARRPMPPGAPWRGARRGMTAGT